MMKCMLALPFWILAADFSPCTTLHSTLITVFYLSCPELGKTEKRRIGAGQNNKKGTKKKRKAPVFVHPFLFLCAPPVWNLLDSAETSLYKFFSQRNSVLTLA